MRTKAQLKTAQEELKEAQETIGVLSIALSNSEVAAESSNDAPSSGAGQSDQESAVAVARQRGKLLVAQAEASTVLASRMIRLQSGLKSVVDSLKSRIEADEAKKAREEAANDRAMGSPGSGSPMASSKRATSLVRQTEMTDIAAGVGTFREV